MNAPLPFHVPQIDDEELQAVQETLKSGWLTTGPKTRQFEADFASYIGVKHAVALNSCTAALHLALAAVGLKEGDEVIVPTMTFAATAEVVHYFKAKPVLIDCRRDDMNMDVSQVEKLLNKNTKAVIPVHFAGHPVDMDPLMEIARASKVAVIEDAAHTLPARYKGRMIGAIGDLTCFSFYATKPITTGEGGMVTTQHDEYTETIRTLSLHGISKDAWKRYSSEGSWYYEILQPGYKYNLTDTAAAIGIEQLKKSQKFLESRKKIAGLYNEAFADLSEVETPTCATNVEHSWHLYVLKLALERLSIDRSEFIQKMKEEGIVTAVHFIPLHLHPFYKKTYAYTPQNFPNASYLADRIVSLPIYPKMTENDVDRVISAVRKIVRASKK